MLFNIVILACNVILRIKSLTLKLRVLDQYKFIVFLSFEQFLLREKP